MRNPARLLMPGIHRFLSSPRVSRRILRKSLVVFLYHEVSDRPSEFNRLFRLNVRPDAFSRHLDLIRERFHIITPEQLVSGDYPRPAAMITFDDGNLSYFREALPLLRGKGIPSAAFLNMGTVKGDLCWSGLVTYLQSFRPDFPAPGGRRPSGNDFCRLGETEVLRYLDSTDTEPLFRQVREFRGSIASEADLRAVSGDPLVYLGNHLYNHYNATLLSGRLRDEYWKNQALIDRSPRATRMLSYPFSCWNRETTETLLKEGAQAIFMGGGVPNFHAGGASYHRVELGDSVDCEQGMVSAVLRNLPSAAYRREVQWA